MIPPVLTGLLARFSGKSRGQINERVAAIMNEVAQHMGTDGKSRFLEVFSEQKKAAFSSLGSSGRTPS